MRITQAKPVLDGRKTKWTLEQVQQVSPGLVRCDWLRFTLPLDAVVKRSPHLNQDLTFFDCLDKRGRDVARMARHADADEVPSSARMVAGAGARFLCSLLKVFEVGAIEDRGMDYYTARAAVMFEGAIVGWVLSGGRESRQAGTVHVNLFGSALLHIPVDGLHKIKTWIDEGHGWITRCDLALDCWQGYEVEGVRTAYLAGEFDVRGKRPGQREHGSWTLGHSRTFEVGSRGTGKLFRGYEKGDELLGHEANDPWVRFEVEFRNNHRVIDSEVLSRPGDFFAGAYPFCARVMDERQADHVAQVIPTQAEVADKTAYASAVRVVRWLRRTAAPAICAVFEHGGEVLETILETERYRTPKRFQGMSLSTMQKALKQVAEAMAPASAPSILGA